MSSSSGVFFDGDEQPQAFRNSNLVQQNMYSNMDLTNVLMESMTSPGAGSLVTEANSGGTPSLKRSASINTDSYMRLPASPLSFNSNNISISGSSVIDGQSPPVHQQQGQGQGLYQGASTATSLPNHGSIFHDNVSHVQKKPRFEIKQEDIVQQQAMRQMLQRQDLTGLQNQNVQLQQLYKQHQFLQSLPLAQRQQVLQSLSPAQRAQFVQLQQQLHSRQSIQQQMQQPATAANRSVDGGVCARRMTQYLYHLRQRPADINYWRTFVAEYYSPRAKQRWCLSVHNNVGHHPSGVFPPANSDVWQCSICGSKSGRGFEATFEVLPRLNEIKFSSGVIDERWCLGLPRECRFDSGIMMVEYEKAVQQSVYEQLHVVHEGRLKVFFTRDLKILSWEFCSRRHEELLPRRLIVPQVSQMLEVAQKWQSTVAESGSDGVSQQDIQTSSNMLVTAGRQLARSLDLQSLNDLGFTKRYVRSLQIAEVVNSMKDLIDVTGEANIGPIEAMKRFHQQASMARLQKAQRMEQMSATQGVANNRNGLSGLVALESGLNRSMNSNFHVGNRGSPALSNYQSNIMRQSLMNMNSRQDASSSFINRSPFQGQTSQSNNSNIPVGYQRFPSGIVQVQQNQSQNMNQNQQSSSQGGDQTIQQHMIQQVLKGMNDNNNGGAKPSISGQSGGGLTRSDSFKGGSHSDSCAGGEKAVDLPHVSDIFQDIVSDFTENGFFDNDETSWKV
ncbi:LIM-domain binding protein/SEUSS [Artemisia annua]|uniref:LIM-domain binding protein/SEUSS n=1 Tax=Artemisia annua TaxID=35608 RepID=A0A2U1QG22_ARTAN|nr:LIM-domain binding protein/SEUSS [Artemisia annua]